MLIKKENKMINNNNWMVKLLKSKFKLSSAGDITHDKMITSPKLEINLAFNKIIDGLNDRKIYGVLLFKDLFKIKKNGVEQNVVRLIVSISADVSGGYLDFKFDRKFVCKSYEDKKIKQQLKSFIDSVLLSLDNIVYLKKTNKKREGGVKKYEQNKK